MFEKKSKAAEAGSAKQLTILAFLVTEVLGNGQTSQGDTGTGSRGLVHLTEHQRALRTGRGTLLGVLVNAGLDHLVIEVVAFAGAFADPGQHRIAAVGLGDVVDELLDEHSLADTSTAEETDLSTTSVGGEEIDDLDTSLQNLGSCP